VVLEGRKKIKEPFSRQEVSIKERITLLSRKRKPGRPLTEARERKGGSRVCVLWKTKKTAKKPGSREVILVQGEIGEEKEKLARSRGANKKEGGRQRFKEKMIYSGRGIKKRTRA